MKWISVNERLPEEVEKIGNEVLVCLIEKERVYGRIKIGVFYKGKFHRDFSKGFIMKVTHWMPLPEPPKN